MSTDAAADPRSGAGRNSVHALLTSSRFQGWSIVLAMVAITLIRGGDGLWFQGDAPRHALNGLFWWDLITAMPRHPLDYAYQYYARYPAIAPATYPPLFYILEGLAFRIFGASPYVARGLVLLFAGVACGYTMAWGRRWIAPMAGWVGLFFALLPMTVVWSSVVMLNMPAVALSMATLYHCRRWIESSDTRQFLFAAAFAVCTLLTYYQAADVLVVCAIWVLLHWREIRSRRQLALLIAVAATGLLPVLGAVLLAPVQAARHLPPEWFIKRISTWTYYWVRVQRMVGWTVILLGSLAAPMSAAMPRWRREVVYLAVWIVGVIVPVSALAARDPRYVLLAAPAFLLAAAIGIHVIADSLPAIAPRWQAALLAGGIAVQCVDVSRLPDRSTSGFREIALYLREQGPTDAVLFDGEHSGVFVFQIRALDPDFHRRVLLASKFLYSYAEQGTFGTFVEELYAKTPEAVVAALRARSGCRWIAIQRSPTDSTGEATEGRKLLLAAVERPEFTRVKSFPVMAGGPRNVDLYRLSGTLEPVSDFDLAFPSFSSEKMTKVAPISR